MSRAPATFRVAEKEQSISRDETKADMPRSARKPKAVAAREAVLAVQDDEDFFAEVDRALEQPSMPTPRRRSWLGRIFFGALGILLSLAVGLWVDRLVRDLFSRADWLGWLALGLATIAVMALAVIVIREVTALLRLTAIEDLRRDARDAFARDNTQAARKQVARLTAVLSAKPETAAGRAALESVKDDIIDGADLLRMAEKELLGPLDALAQKEALDAAKRVSVVTAVSPRAVVDVAYVLFEAARLIRRVAEIYGGRPGFLGFLHLIRSILAHLAVTGSMAAGETLLQQVVGHGLAARLSTKLGEGVINGMMTARIGIAAMAAARPMDFTALPRPGISDFLKALMRFADNSKGDGDKSSDTARE